MSLKNPPVARATMLIRKPVEKVAQALAEGFNLFIAACKALLEHGVQLNLVTDKNPHAGIDRR